MMVAEDDWVDYCLQCEVVVEGQTVEKEDETPR